MQSKLNKVSLLPSTVDMVHKMAKELVMVKIVSRCSSKPWSHHIIYVQGAPCPLAGLHSLCIKGMEVLARKRNFDPCNAKA